MWDKLSSAEVASLTACHLDQPKTADIPKADFKMISTSGGSLDTSIEGLQPRCLSWKLQRDRPGRWVFGRGNAATHLIRNATGRGDEGLRQDAEYEGTIDPASEG